MSEINVTKEQREQFLEQVQNNKELQNAIDLLIALTSLGYASVKFWIAEPGKIKAVPEVQLTVNLTKNDPLLKDLCAAGQIRLIQSENEKLGISSVKEVDSIGIKTP